MVSKPCPLAWSTQHYCYNYTEVFYLHYQEFLIVRGDSTTEMQAVARLDNHQRCLPAPANLWASAPKKKVRLVVFTSLNTNPDVVRDTINVFKMMEQRKTDCRY